MTRRIERLTPDRLADLAELDLPCRSCVHWELDPVRRARLRTSAAAAAEKDAWLSVVLREWGSCGRVVVIDDRVVGYISYAPAAFVPGAAGYPTAPVSGDAVLMTAVRVADTYDGGGLGRLLVQAMARDLIERGGVRAVEAFGDSRCGAVRCLVATDFLSRVGFRTHRPHPSTPRMRMDLRSALTWRDEFESSIDRLGSAVRPKPAPAPEVARREGPGEP
ncbi:GNAT family N-acetyltransferase [soil metagenome]